MSRTPQYNTGADRLQIGTVKSFYYGHKGEHGGESDLIKIPVQLPIIITMSEWIKAICGNHNPEFQRDEVGEFGEVWQHFKCASCQQGEKRRGT